MAASWRLWVDSAIERPLSATSLRGGSWPTPAFVNSLGVMTADSDSSYGSAATGFDDTVRYYTRALLASNAEITATP